MHELLIKLGLSDKEASVYLACLELAEDTVQNIGEKAKVNRATTYVILEKLLELGLVSTVERGKKTVFIAEDPRELGNILEEQQRGIERRRAMLADSLGELKAIYNANQEKPSVRFFEGAEGLDALERVGYDQFKPGTEVLTMIPVDIIEDSFPSSRKKAISERVKLGITSRTIYTHKDGPKYPTYDKEQLRQALFIPREKLPIDVTIQIYENWGVKLFHFSGTYFGVLIQHPGIARNLKVFFELAWKGAQETEE